MKIKWEDVGVLLTSLGLKRVEGKIKEKPKDFIVCEILKGHIKELFRESGYPLFILRKYDLDVIKAKIQIEKRIGSRVHLLGLKDKRALCYQFFSSTKKRIRMKKYGGNNLSFFLVKRTERPLTRSDLMANGFAIFVRTDKKDLELQKWAESLEGGKIANFFGIQRFGEENPNHIVGERLIRRDFVSAAKLALNRDFKSDEAAIKALRKLPIAVRRLYVQSYQAYLFNLALSHILHDIGNMPDEAPRHFRKCPLLRKNCKEPVMIPEAQIIGYSFRPKKDTYSKYMEYIMESVGISYRDFYIKGMEEISAEGAFRPVAIPAWHVNYEAKEDGVFFRFILHTGSYATVALRELFKF